MEVNAANAADTAVVAWKKNGGCCSRLRWKGMFIDAEPDPSIPNTRDGMYWCSHTMTCLGPDSRVADEESCCDGRRCYEPW